MTYIFPPRPIDAVPVRGEDRSYAVSRIFCVGRNYAAHVREMGFDPDREEPFYFTKSPSTIFHTGGALPYPPGTENFHHEMELVVAIGEPAFKINTGSAASIVYGYACGLDMTRRDLQLTARDKGRPWSFGKDVEGCAVIAPIQKATDIGHPEAGRIWLKVNDEDRQDSDLGALIWSVPELVANLSQFYHLAPGDLIYTGTPDGVGPVVAGDKITGGIDGIGEISLSITDAE